MEIVYKKLTAAELETFIQMRIEQLREEGATEYGFVQNDHFMQYKL